MPDLKVLFSDLTHVETDLWNVVDARLRSEHDLPLTWFEPMKLMSKYTACRVLRHQGGVVDHRRRHEQACRPYRGRGPVSPSRQPGRPPFADHRAHACRAAVAGKGDQVVRGRVAHTARVRGHRASAGPVRCDVDEVAGLAPPCHVARADRPGVVRSRWPPAVFRGSGTRLGAVAYAFTRSPDAADLSMAAMTSWRRTASAKPGTVWVPLSMSAANAA